MVKIIPFRGLRYSLSKIGSLDKVICPPYDIITFEEQKRLYKTSPYNIVRLEYSKGLNDRKYLYSKQLLQDWLTKKILVFDKTPCYYLYTQTFRLSKTEKPLTRYSVFVALELTSSYKHVRPHEKTFTKHKQERLKLYNSIHLNTSPVFATFEDNSKKIFVFIKKFSVKTKPIVSFTNVDYTKHKLWIISDTDDCKFITNLFKNKKIYIADGHHRFETSKNYFKSHKSDEESRYCLMCISSMEDPGLVVLQTHRLVVLPKHFDFENWIKKQEKYFYIKIVEKPYFCYSRLVCHSRENGNLLVPSESGIPDGVYPVVPPKRETYGAGMMPMFKIQYKSQWFNVKPKPVVFKLMKTKVFPDKSKVYQTLDINILHNLLLKDLPVKEIKYFKDVNQMLKEKKGFYNSHSIAIFLSSPKIKDIKGIANAGEFMPHKSTYFYPKLATGVVMYSLKKYNVY